KAAHVIEFEELCKKDELVTHPWLPANWVCWNTGISILDSFLVAQDRFFPGCNDLAIDRMDVISRIVGHWSVSDEDWPELRAGVRDSLSDDPNLQTWFDKLARRHDNLVESRKRTKAHGSSVSAAPIFPKGRGAIDGSLHLDASLFGVKEI